jgi:Tfp pilus assembly protein PilF
MVADSRFSREPYSDYPNCWLYSKEANQLSRLRVEIAIPPARLVLLSLIILLTPLAGVAQGSREMSTVSTQQLLVPTKARNHLMLAQREFSRSNFIGADKEIDKALRVDAICAAAFSMRALLRLAARDFHGAVENATRALALDPDDSDAYLALATAYNSLGEFQTAEAATQHALAMRPELWQGKLELAKALYGEGQLVQSLRELDELNKDFPDVHLVRANILVRLGREDEAMEEFRRFVQEAPNDPRSEQVKRLLDRGGEAAIPSSSLHR